jgi:methylenetetrahydrofolate dehydrogenase (NADP+)/methenyltetrahydrofolate cyclohydrolase
MIQKHIKLIPGKNLAEKKLAQLQKFITENSEGQINDLGAPRLEIFQLGDDPASTIYTDLKAQKAGQIGIDAHVSRFLLSEIQRLREAITQASSDPQVHGVMLQSPLPGISWDSAREVFNLITPEKDVDGLTAQSMGQIWQQKSLAEILDNPVGFISATPLGVMDCLTWVATEEGQDVESFLAGKEVLIINRSNIVGKPLAALMLAGNATVKLAHSATRDLAAQIKAADIILTATGVSQLVKLEDLRAGQIVIDIAITKRPDQQGVAGDLDLTGIDASAGIGAGGNIDHNDPIYIAPVPGGVGPLTIVNLLQNTLLSYSRARLGKFSYRELNLAMFSNDTSNSQTN